MQWRPNIQLKDDKEYILCAWRKRWVRLTPEEWVRQNVLHSLVENYGYPFLRIAVEQHIEVGQTDKRCDAVVYGKELEPLMIIEFKAESVSLTQKVFDQVAVYNHRLNVEYFLISNGISTIACQIKDSTYIFLDNIPFYSTLCQNK